MKIKKRILVLWYLLIIAVLIIFLFPVYWMMVSSFQPNSALMSLPPKFWPKELFLDNYKMIANNMKYLVYFKNSVIVASLSMLFSIAASLFAGYAFSRFHFPCKSAFMTIIMNIQIFPVTVITISLFTFYSKMGLMDSYAGLVLANIIYSLPFTVWFIKAFFDTVPVSLDESAKIDGCGRMKTMMLVIMPLIKPGIVAIGIYTFLYSWDDFLFAMTIMKTEAMKTLPLGIAQSFIGEFAQDYAGMMTLSVIASVPVVIAFMFTQKYMVGGLVNGAVKG